MGEVDVPLLRAAFESANTYSEWATLIVVVGLIIEFGALLWFSEEMHPTEKRILIAGSILVCIGVGGEYVYGSRSSNAAVELQQISDERVANLNKEAESLKLELAKLTTPRHISDWDLYDISQSLRKFSGSQFDASIKQGDDEAGNLLIQIESALADAGWTQLNWAGGSIVLTRANRHIIGPNAGMGIIVSVKPEDKDALFEAAAALSDSLVKAGIASEVSADVTDDITVSTATNAKTIHLFVGAKPY